MRTSRLVAFGNCNDVWKLLGSYDIDAFNYMVDRARLVFWSADCLCDIVIV